MARETVTVEEQEMVSPSVFESARAPGRPSAAAAALCWAAAAAPCLVMAVVLQMGCSWETSLLGPQWA